MNQPSWRRQTLPRLVLLVALAFGILGMHTFGHPPSLGSTDVGHMRAAAHEIDALPAALQGHDGSHRGSLHASTVCMAMVGGVLALTSASVRRQRRWEPGVPAARRSRAMTRRSAPPSRLIGLHLTALSVVRT